MPKSEAGKGPARPMTPDEWDAYEKWQSRKVKMQTAHGVRVRIPPQGPKRTAYASRLSQRIQERLRVIFGGFDIEKVLDAMVDEEKNRQEDDQLQKIGWSQPRPEAKEPDSAGH